MNKGETAIEQTRRELLEQGFAECNGNWYQNNQVGGYIDSEGIFIVCEEYGTDRELDKHAVEIANGDGYYNQEGKYVAYSVKNE